MTFIPHYIETVKGSILRRSKRGVEPIVWTLRAELPRDPKEPGKRKQKAITFKGSKDDAEEALRRFVSRASKKTGPPYDSGITFDDLFDKWIVADSSRQKPRAASTTYHDQRRYETWVRPVFGQRVVATITPLEVEDFYESLRRWVPGVTPGLSANSVVRVHALLAAMTKWGFRKQLIESNIMDHVVKPRGETLPPEAPSIEVVQLMLNYLWENDKILWLAVRLCATIGLRRSELLSIRWSDFVLDGVGTEGEGSLLVSTGIVAVPKKRYPIKTDTKGGARSRRTLYLDKQLVSDIKAVRQTFEDYRRRGYVFSYKGNDTIPWYPDTLSRKLSEARSLLPIPDEMGGWYLERMTGELTFRGLRIFCASQLFANKNDVKTAKSVLGHASLVTTDRYYLAFNEEKHREATVSVGDQLARKVSDDHIS